MGTDTAGDTVRAPAHRLAGRARVALDVSVERLEKGLGTAYAFDASVAPFLGEHLQIGIAPTATVLDGRGTPAFHTVGSSVVANYVFGGDRRWRGYVGGLGAATTASNSQHVAEIGAQAGALFFVTPALALRGELRYRDFTEPASYPRHVTVLYLGLDPYLFGDADTAPITGAGFGVIDVAGYYYYERLMDVSESGIAGTVAPYLTRWAQIGAVGEADGGSQGITAHQLRGFGRLYLPLTVRTQPFAEGFAETTTYGGEAGGLTSYGGRVGVRRMLDANVALDVAIERRLHPIETLGNVEFPIRAREPGSTSLIVGIITQVGHAH